MRDQVREELSGATSRQAVDTSATETAELARAVEQLNQSLAELAPGPGDRPALVRGFVESWKGPGYASLDAMHVRIDELRQSGADHWGNDANDELTKAHLLWTRDDVLDRYGAPKGVYTARGIGMVYDSFKLPKETCWFEFTTRESVVTEVCLVCEDDR